MLSLIDPENLVRFPQSITHYTSDKNIIVNNNDTLKVNQRIRRHIDNEINIKNTQSLVQKNSFGPENLKVSSIKPLPYNIELNLNYQNVVTPSVNVNKNITDSQNNSSNLQNTSFTLLQNMSFTTLQNISITNSNFIKTNKKKDRLSQALSSLSVEILEKLYRVYENDFKIFGYGLENLLGYEIA